MRSIAWVTSLSLVAAALGTLATVDYGRRHPETGMGRMLASVGLAPATALAEAPPPPVIQAVEEPKPEPDVDHPPTALQDLKIMSVDKEKKWDDRPGPTQPAQAAEPSKSGPSKGTLEATISFTFTPAAPNAKTPVEAIANEERGSVSECDMARQRCCGGPRSEVCSETRSEARCCTEAEGCCSGRPCSACVAAASETPTAATAPPQIARTTYVIPVMVPVPARPRAEAAPRAAMKPAPLTTHFYNVEDLITEAQGHVELMSLIRQMVAPDTWTREGNSAVGFGEITYFTQGRTLIVRQTTPVHEQLQTFLSRMREEIVGKRQPGTWAIDQALSEGPLAIVPSFELSWQAEVVQQASYEFQLVAGPEALDSGWLIERIAWTEEPLLFAPEAVTMATPILDCFGR